MKAFGIAINNVLNKFPGFHKPICHFDDRRNLTGYYTRGILPLTRQSVEIVDKTERFFLSF